MVAAINGLSDRAGVLTTRINGDDLVDDWLMNSLFDGTIRVCHLADVSLAKRQFARLRALFECVPQHPAVIMVRASKYNEGRYPGVTVIEEPLVTTNNIQDVLDYVAKCSKLKFAVLLRNHNAFVEHFDEWIADEEPTTLPYVFGEFTRTILLNSTRGDLQLKIPSKLHRDPLGKSFLARSLERVVDDGSRVNIFAVLRAASIRKARGLSDRALIEDLLSATLRLIRRRCERKERVALTRAASIESLLLWGALLLVWSAELASSRNKIGYAADSQLVMSLQVLLGDFATRASNMSADPVEGLWDTLTHAIAELDVQDLDEEEEQSKSALMKLLAAECKKRAFVPWLAKLTRVVATTRKAANFTSPEVASNQRLSRGLNSFAEVVGQRNVVDEIRSRFAEARHDRPLLLSGPAGSGKLAIARLYAKSLLCEGLREPGQIDPCGNCASCEGAEAHSVWGYLELNMGRSDIQEIARRQIAQLAYEPLSKRRVLILKGLERSNEGTDAFLKVLEKGARFTTFIGLTENESSVRSAAVSRSDCLRIGSLDRVDARALLERWIAPHSMDTQALDVIALLGDGRPGPMWRDASLAMEVGAWSVTKVRSLFELEWSERTFRYLFAALGDSVEEAEALLQQIHGDPRRAVLCIQAVLYYALLGHGGTEPSLVGLEEQLRSFSKSIGEAADRRGLKKDELAVQLAGHWLRETVADGDSLLEIGRGAQLIIAGAPLMVTLPNIADLVH